MLTEYFRSPTMVARLRASAVGAYLDELTGTMARSGFATLTIVEHVRTVSQLGEWAKRRGLDLPRWDDSMLAGFRRHLVRRRLAKRDRAIGHAVAFLAFLRVQGVIAPAAPSSAIGAGQNRIHSGGGADPVGFI